MARLKCKWFSFRTILIILTAFLVGYVVHQNWPDILETFNHLQEANGFILLLLIPEQLFMYYACGQIFFSYLQHQKNVRKFSQKEILTMATELNFINHAVPAGGIGGLAFLTYRLSPYRVSAGQASFLYIFRYAVTTVINYFQALIAIIVLVVLNSVPSEAWWIVPVSLLMNFGVFAFLGVVIYIASSKKRIKQFSRFINKITKLLARALTFGRKKKIMDFERIEHYFDEIHKNVNIARKNKRFLKKPALWGLAYSFLEIGTYWIVAISLGRPELLPYIMVGEAIGSVFDGIIPYGLYELGMAGVMIALGVDFPVATIVTVMTRVIILVFTIASGSYPYYQAIKSNKKKEEV